MSQGTQNNDTKLEIRLARLAQAHSTGVLEVSHGKRRRRFWLREGGLVASSSNLKKEQAEQVAPTLPGATPDRVNEHVTVLRLAAALSAGAGKTHWRPDEAPKREFPARLRVVVWAALELAFDTPELIERLESEFPGYPASKVADADELSGLGLPLDYREWLVGLDGYRSVLEVSQFGPGEPRSCAAGIYLASICGALEYRQPDLDRAVARPAEHEELDGDEVLIDDEADSGPSSSTDISSLIAASVTPLGGGEAPSEGSGYELELEDDREWDGPSLEEDDEALGDQEIPFDDEALGDQEMVLDDEEVTNPGGEDWSMDEVEASLRAEIHRIIEADNVFEVLGLSHEASVEDFRTAYFRLARVLHPDRVGDEKPELQTTAADAFDRARAAWEIVKDDELREETIARVIHGKKTEEEEAMEQVQELLAIEKLFDRGLAQFHRGRIVQAHEMFSQVIQLSAKHPEFEVPEFRIYLGYCLWRLNHERDEDEASRGVEMLQNAMNKAQRHQEGWVLLGRAVKQRGYSDEARKLFIRALKINPENKDALREMGRLKAERGGGEADKPKGFFGRLFSRGKKKGDKKPKKGD